MSRFFTFRQNNSGGRFVVNENVSHYVIMEANSPQQANALAEVVGLYFDGVGDCPCCGTRWDEQWDDEEGDDEPKIYGEPAKGFKQMIYKDHVCTIHYFYGRKEQFVLEADR